VRPGEHVFDEPLVPRDIDNPRLRAVGKIEVGKSQINRNAALFFFLEPIRILSGQRFDQAGFPLIDLAGGADDVGHL